MTHILAVLTVALLVFSDPSSARAQEADSQSIFRAIGPNMPAFDQHRKVWQDNPHVLADLGASPITRLDAQPSPQLRRFNSQVTAFMQSNNARKARFRAKDGTIIDIHLGDQGDILYDPISTPTEHVLWHEMFGGNNQIVGDVTIQNTGEPDISTDEIRIAIALNDLAVIGALPTQVMTQETPSWSTVAIYGQTTGRLPYCTGVAISPSLVLSAAHCFCDKFEIPQDFTVNVRPQFGTEPASGQHAARIPIESFIQYRANNKSFCEHSGTFEEKMPYGDIILLKLARTIPSTLAEAQDETLRIIADYSVASVIAPNQPVWTPKTCQFQTLGFGVGQSATDPNLVDTQNPALRRDLTYEVTTETWMRGRAGITVSLFDRTDEAVCPGDSGSGLFVPSNVTCGHASEKIDRALAGIASKVGVFRECFIADRATGLSRFISKPTTVTRLDTPEVQAWLAANAAAFGEQITFVDVLGPATLLAQDQ